MSDEEYDYGDYDYDMGGDNDYVTDYGDNIVEDEEVPGWEDGGGKDDEDPDDDPLIEMENEFYNAKGIYEEENGDKNEAVAGFERVLKIQEDKMSGQHTNWGFKAGKWLVRLYAELSHPESKVKQTYASLLKNYSDKLGDKEKSITKLLDSLSTYAHIGDIFQMTLDKFDELKLEKASVRLELMRAKVMCKTGDWARLSKSLTRLYAACRLPDGSDDPTKGNQLLEIYAMHIMMENDKQNNKKLKELVTRALAINGICSQKTSGTIHECAGKMHLREGHYHDAYTAFFDAFKYYDEGGCRVESVASLKSLIISNMLSESLDIFNDRRGATYATNQEIVPFKSLSDAFQHKDINEFEKIISANKKTFHDDKYVAAWIPGVRRRLQKRIFLELVKPYTTLAIPFVAKVLRQSTEECEELIVELVLDGEVDLSVDQIGGVLIINKSPSESNRKYAVCQKWTSSLTTLSRNVMIKVN
eukprot:TRINITY_DN11152_c0_g1_i1.p1 TRINITY_DN11152_c0_g1~~TRINITY_DN11152_c0_g1_i1.p1  ORF type:complete len:473 (-),score=115.18 TRINITY_DN11152_c0_g1_i1:65-1483(-)